MHLKPGTTIEGNDYLYTIVSTLGQGAFGITYLVHSRLKSDTMAGVRTMALKEYFIKDVNGRQNNLVTCASEGGLFDKMRAKFLNEARNLENFNSASIVKIYEVFDANNTSYLSMEFIAGGDLESYIKDHGPLPAATVKSFASQLAQALRIMHRKNILHLDMKPSNVMMRNDKSLVLIDFGFSKRFNDEGNPASSSTLGGGTELYRPLEQQTYKGSYHNSLPATLDVYSLSATIYKMATGRDPLSQNEFDEQFPYKLLEAVGASPQLTEMLKKGLALRPRDRIQNMDEYLDIINTLPEEYPIIHTRPVNDLTDTDNQEPPKTTGKENPISGKKNNVRKNKHKVGDLHPTQNWIWTEYAPGKFDWRVNKNGEQKNDKNEIPKKSGKSRTLWVIITMAVIVIGVVIGTAIWLAGGKEGSAPIEPEPAAPDTLLITGADGNTFKYIGDLDSTYSIPIPHGVGTGVYETGTYVGEYRHGLRHGEGIFDSADGMNHFEGTFTDNLYSKGKLTMPDGMYYRGTFKNGQPYSGKWYNADNSVYYKLRNGK